MHVLPTPLSPIRSNLKSRSYCFFAIARALLRPRLLYATVLNADSSQNETGMSQRKCNDMIMRIAHKIKSVPKSQQSVYSVLAESGSCTIYKNT